MGLMASDKGGNFELFEEGMHQAVCYAIYDLGTQWNEKWGKSAHRAIVTWEFPEVRMEIEDKESGETINLPRSLSKEYTLSLNGKANLRKDLESWRGRAFTKEELKGFDVSKLLGVNCLIQVINVENDGKTYSNVNTITPIMKTMEKREPENALKLFIFGESQGIPEGAPDWIIEKIQSAQEWNGSIATSEEPKKPEWMNQANPAPADEPTDDVPF